LRLRRESRVLEDDVAQDHALYGERLAQAFAGVWEVEGFETALRQLEAESAGRDHVAVTFDPAPTDGIVAHILREDDGVLRMRTWVPIPPFLDSGAPRGSIRLDESLEPIGDYLHITVVRTLVTAALATLVAGAIGLAVGLVIVGRPIRALVEKTRRTAAGDFSGPLALRKRDEIGQLAAEIDAMCRRLEEAREQLEVESRARRRSDDLLRHADRLITVGKLAAVIAHELGTPLTVVTARAAMIASGETMGAESIAGARTMVEQCQRMSGIIRGMLDLSCVTPPRREPVDLCVALRQATALLAPVAERRGIRIEVASHAAPVRASADPAQLQQVISNLFVNAIQAMPRGGVLSAGPLAADPDGREPGFYVRDDGRGIEPEALAMIFEPFFTTRGGDGGTGLGLSIVTEIVREHGGRIDVESAVGAGTTFRVRLPSQEHP
jgi:signal transduction histidine kinase